MGATCGVKQSFLLAQTPAAVKTAVRRIGVWSTRLRVGQVSFFGFFPCAWCTEPPDQCCGRLWRACGAVHCLDTLHELLSGLTCSLQALLLFGLEKRAQDAVYLQELAHQQHRGEYPIPGRVVCRTAYLLLRGIGKDRLAALQQQLLSQEGRGSVSVAPAVHGNKGAVRPSLKTVLALNFIVWLALSFGDLNPVTGIVHVWMFRCVSTLWVLFGTWCSENSVSAKEKLGMSSFFALFQRGSRYFHLLAHVRWKRCVTQKICSTCGALMLERREMFSHRVVRGSLEWLAWEARSAVHHALIWAERRCYSELRAQVRAGAEKISMFIIDASKPLRYPRRLFDSQAARAIPQISGAFVGVLSHAAHRALAFTSPAPGVPIFHAARGGSGKVKARAAGTNYTWESTDVNCTILLQVLLDEYHAGLLKRHVHVQVDGGSDARGFVLLMMLALLVALDVIETATIASLIPGHTHDDVDAFFSRLWKALKTRAGVTECRTWNEILRRACEVFPGWHVPSNDKVGPAGVTTIGFVWKFRELFAQGSGYSTRPCLSPKLKGLWGAGKDHSAKPSKFVISTGVSRRPVITAYLSSVVGAAVFKGFDSLEIFQFAPKLDLLGSYDLSIGWLEQHAALVAALNAGDCREAGYTFTQRAEISAMVVDFVVAPLDPFGSRAALKFVALLELGFAPAKGPHAGGKGSHPQQQQKAVNNVDVDSDVADEWNPDNNEKEEEEEEAGEIDSDLEEEASASDAPQFVIEEWLDRRFNNIEQCNEYSIVFEGYPEPEWTLERRIAGGVPRAVDERFDRRSDAEKAKARSARQAAAFRAINTGLLEEEEEDVAVSNAPPGGEPPAKAPRRSKRNKGK